MNTKKVIIVLSMLCLLAAGVWAQTSGLNQATAGALKGDADYLLDVNEWSNLSVGKFYGFSELGTNNTANLGFATNTNGFRVAGYWYGDLWANNSYNTVKALVGKDNWGVLLYWNNDESSKRTTIGASVGYNINADLGVFGSFYTSAGDTANYSYTGVNGGAIYHIEDKGAVSSLVRGTLSYSKTTNKANGTVTSETGIITVTPAYELTYKPAGNFTYGLVAKANYSSSTREVSGTSTTTTTFTPVICNGLSINVAKNLLLNLGIETTLPYIRKSGDTETHGTMANTFTAGVTVPLSNVGTLDTYCDIDYNPSLDDLWNTHFNIVVSLHF